MEDLCPRVQTWVRKIVYASTDIWDYFPTTEEFLLCMDVKDGSLIIAILGMMYGLAGLILILSIVINYSEWKSLYEKKQDLFVYLTLISLTVSVFLFTSFILLIGTLREFELLVKIYLWYMFVHMVLNCAINFGICGFCLTKNSCLQNSSPGVVIMLLLITASYTVFLFYIMMVVNSYRFECR